MTTTDKIIGQIATVSTGTQRGRYGVIVRVDYRVHRGVGKYTYVIRFADGKIARVKSSSMHVCKFPSDVIKQRAGVRV